MAIHQALYTGVSGLTSNADGMAVIANNIANANTRSYKNDRAEFEDLLSQSLSENSSLGRGARLRNIQTNFSQGAISTTGGITDLAIQGDGFFITRNETHDVKESNSVFYTRQGTFSFNRDGYLTDSMNGKVLGYMSTDGNGTLSSELTPIQISINSVPPAASTIINVGANLDSREISPKEEFDIMRPSQTSNFSNTVAVFDNMGGIHQVATYYRKTENSDNKNIWQWFATVDGKEIDGAEQVNALGEKISTVVAQGELEFDPAGKPVMNYKTKQGYPTYIDTMEKTDAIEVKFANGALMQKIQFNFGPAQDEKGNLGSQMCTSMAAKSSVFSHSQNGYEAGYLKSLKIDGDGSVRGVFTNGVERRLCSVGLAVFPNINGLQKVGRNSYIAPAKAGEPRTGLPQSGARGSVYSSSLEESNVDLAQQFVDMITTQRAFQANSKSVVTTDSLLEEVINLKR